MTLLAGGHGLLIGVPGLAKTRLVETLGIVLGLDWKRIQFTPDLMPADIIGSEVLEEDGGKRAFRFLKGPVFTQLLMADEINRASPRTQSALLQAMQERQVTVAGQRYDLPKPFHVLATQNPLEQEGTYPLPEAQLDRFLLQIDVGYPDKDAERRMLIATTFGEEAAPKRVCTPHDLMRAQQHRAPHLPVGEKVVDAILRLVRAARPDEGGASDLRDYIAWGPGPRASQAFMLAVRATALIEGRLAPSIDDVVGAGASGAAPSHGAELLRARRRHDDHRRHRPAVPEPSLTDPARASLQRGSGGAVGARLPPLLVDAERLASAVSLGVHGRRKAGMGESFWQFRRYPRRRSVHRRSTGGNRRSRSICSCASANGKRRSRCGSGATARRACGSNPAAVDEDRARQPAGAWRWRRCWCAAASASRLLRRRPCARELARRVAPHRA